MERKSKKGSKEQERLHMAATLRKYRIAKRLSQEEVARYLHINRSTYTYYELAKTMPSIFQLSAFAKLTGITLEELMNNTDYSYLQKNLRSKI